MRLGFIGRFVDEELWPLLDEFEDFVPNAGGIVMTDGADGLPIENFIGLVFVVACDWDDDDMRDFADGGKI